MLKKVATVLLDQVSPFELGLIAEVFGSDRTASGLPGYTFSTCSPGRAPVRSSAGFDITPSHDLAPLEDADLIAVPAASTDPAVGHEVADALRRAAARGAHILSVSTGAFTLGEPVLLDGVHRTTHWVHATELARRFPLAKVDPDVLYVHDGNILTSAGTASGIDACLYLVRLEHGSTVATALARRMVVPPHRDGGQAQYIETPLALVPAAPTLEPLLDWMIAHLPEPMTVESLAARVHMSPRTSPRRFRPETGATPFDWLVAQRVLLARQLLEETSLTVDDVAARTGFGTAAQLRHHFGRRLSTTPQSYRTTFSRRAS